MKLEKFIDTEEIHSVEMFKYIGWKHVPGKNTKLKVFRHSFDTHDIKCDIYVWFSDEGSYNEYGDLGIVSIRAVINETLWPELSFEDLENIKETISDTEDLLVSLNIPFILKYGFHGENAEELNKANAAIRENYLHYLLYWLEEGQYEDYETEDY